MNIYQKLQKCRVELQEMNLKKSGENKFAKYKYYELGDFLPSINILFNTHNLFSNITFTNELANLEIVNSEKPDEIIEFCSPMRDLDLKGANAIQALGGIQTYQRRYLYMNALEIVENDIFDGQSNDTGVSQEPSNEQKQTQNTTAPKEEKKSIEDIKKIIGDYMVKEYGKDNCAEKLVELTKYEWNGKEVAGVKSLKELSDKRTLVLYGKIKPN